MKRRKMMAMVMAMTLAAGALAGCGERRSRKDPRQRITRAILQKKTGNLP